MKTYITFGQVHRHEFNGKIFDKDCIAVIEAESYREGRIIAFDIFGRKFCWSYPEEEWHEDKMRYFPRGYIEVKQ